MNIFRLPVSDIKAFPKHEHTYRQNRGEYREIYENVLIPLLMKRFSVFAPKRPVLERLRKAFNAYYGLHIDRKIVRGFYLLFKIKGMTKELESYVKYGVLMSDSATEKIEKKMDEFIALAYLEYIANGGKPYVGIEEVKSSFRIKLLNRIESWSKLLGGTTTSKVAH